MNMSDANEQRRIESIEDVQDFLDRLIYAIEKGSATIHFQKSQQVDNKRNKQYTNRYGSLLNLTFLIGKGRVIILKVIKSEEKLCLICMEEHTVDTVEMTDKETFKGEEVSFKAIYEYCSNADEILEAEEMIKKNSLAMKDAYRKKVGLLTSEEIEKIREKYGLSQKDFSAILDWGRSTITRYENHQVQDRAHDDVLRKVDADPKWFLEILERSKERISLKAFQKYYQKAKEQLKAKQNQYLIDSILAMYAGFDDEYLTGHAKLNLNKVIEMINYLAIKVDSLHKVKLMKMLWYADFLHYKRHGKAISGLVYSALPMGAVPEGHHQIIELEGVNVEPVFYEENVGYKFNPPAPEFNLKELTNSEIEVLDKVAYRLGHLNANEIIDKMHKEKAFRETEYCSLISFSYAEHLTLD